MSRLINYFRHNLGGKRYLGGFPEFYTFYMKDRKALNSDRSMRYSFWHLEKVYYFLEQNVDARTMPEKKAGSCSFFSRT